MSTNNTNPFPRETFSFVVVCPHADQVFLLGDFNGWSTGATPMEETEQHVWEVSLDLPAGDHRFSYFVLDQQHTDGQTDGHTASFGGAYLLPGTWAAVVRSSPDIGPVNPPDLRYAI